MSQGGITTTNNGGRNAVLAPRRELPSTRWIARHGGGSREPADRGSFRGVVWRLVAYLVGNAGSVSGRLGFEHPSTRPDACVADQQTAIAPKTCTSGPPGKQNSRFRPFLAACGSRSIGLYGPLQPWIDQTWAVNELGLDRQPLSNGPAFCGSLAIRRDCRCHEFWAL